MATPNEELVKVAVLTNIPLEEATNDPPSNLFTYLEPRLTALVGFGKLAYAAFNPNTLQARRDPTTNKPIYNIDLPRYGMTPSLEYRMIGSRQHLDASLETSE